MPDTLHQMTPEIAALTVEEIAARYTARFIDRTPDWDAFADARAPSRPPDSPSASCTSPRARATPPTPTR